MDTTELTEPKENWKEDKESLKNEISSLKKWVNEYKKERKSDWKSFKVKYYEDMDKVEKSLKKLKDLHKK